jgi:FAD:protein FMN transferase
MAADVHRVEHIMGTAISVEVVRGPDDITTLVDNVFAWFTEVDRLFSTYKVDSEVCRIEHGELALENASDDVQHVFRMCAKLWTATSGYFDVQATHHLDPSGYVKGWAVQVASDQLLSAGAGNHSINAGGDVRVRGVEAGGQPWRIGIQHPYEKDKVAWILEGTDLAIATSGTYERGYHVLDPFTGQPARDLISVTVTGPDLGIADAYATAAMAMGARSLEWLASLSVSEGYESAVVMEDGRAFRSDRLPVVAEEI